MDLLDQNLLKLLIKDSRIPSTSIAKRLNISREVASYRINRLVKSEIIRGFNAEINLEALGFITASFFVVLKSTRHEEFKDFVSKLDHVVSVAELGSIFSFKMTIVGKTLEELDSRFLEISKRFEGDIIEHKLILHRRNSFFHEKYFGEKPNLTKKTLPEKLKIDKVDKVILKELSANSRIGCERLSKKLSISGVAIAKRIRNLKNPGVIKNFSISIDLAKLGMYQYYVFIDNKDLFNKDGLKSLLFMHGNVNFVADYIGDPFLEFGLFVKDPYEVKPILLGIEEKFPDNKFTKVALLQNEIVSAKPPACVFSSLIDKPRRIKRA